MFLQASVILSTGGGCSRFCSNFGGCSRFCSNFSGGRSFFGGVPPNFRGGPPNFQGGFLQIFGGCLFWGGSSKFSGGRFPLEYDQRSAGTHPTGMHSCSHILMDGSDIKAAAHVPKAQLPVGKVVNIKAILQSTGKIQTVQKVIWIQPVHIKITKLSGHLIWVGKVQIQIQRRQILNEFHAISPYVNNIHPSLQLIPPEWQNALCMTVQHSTTKISYTTIPHWNQEYWKC